MIHQLPGPEAARGFDKLLVLEREHLAADDARHRQPEQRADHQKEDYHAVDADRRESRFVLLILEQCHQKDYDEDKRNRVEDIDDAHHDIVDSPAEVPGDSPVNDTDHKRNKRRDQGRGD